MRNTLPSNHSTIAAMLRSTDFLDASRLPRGAILVALSGGADSVALLVALVNADRTVYAAHLNHMLRGNESDRDEQFCRDLCVKLGVPLTVERIDVTAQKQQGEGLEEAARRIRYDFLERVAAANDCAYIATAHNANDNAETVLMNLARGSGLDGIAGIAPERKLGSVTLIRPILHRTRAEIEDYLRETGCDYVTDRTNADTVYTRNFVRHEIVPRMLRVNPRFVEHTFALSAGLRRGDSADDAWRVAYRELTGGSLDRAHIGAIRKLMSSTKPSGTVSLPHGVIARRQYDKLTIEHPAQTAPLDEKPLKLGINHFGEWRVTLINAGLQSDAYGAAALRADCANMLTVRPRATGDTLSPDGRQWTKTLQKLLIDEKIPQLERDLLPIVCVNSIAAAIPGFAADRKFAAQSGQSAILIIFEKKDENLRRI